MTLRPRPGGRDRRYGHRQRRPADDRYPAGGGAGRPRDVVCRRLPRLVDQNIGPALPAARRHRPANLWIGIKELWEVAPDRHQPGLVVHTMGWPLDTATYGGSFLYHPEHGRWPSAL